jgi:hypothetical protein
MLIRTKSYPMAHLELMLPVRNRSERGQSQGNRMCFFCILAPFDGQAQYSCEICDHQAVACVDSPSQPTAGSKSFNFALMVGLEFFFSVCSFQKRMASWNRFWAMASTFSRAVRRCTWSASWAADNADLW